MFEDLKDFFDWNMEIRVSPKEIRASQIMLGLEGHVEFRLDPQGKKNH